MPTPARLTSRERRALRQAIVAELERVDDQIRSLSRTFDDIVDASAMANVDDEHDPEGTTIAWERSQVSALLQEAQVERDRLRESLGRVGDDDYGVCEVCRCFIGAERLLALPSTKRCVRCAN